MALHVGNLSRNVSEEHLRDIFGTFGALASVELSVDPIVKLSKVNHISMRPLNVWPLK